MELLLAWLVFAVIVGVAANSRGRSGIAWIFIAILLSPLLALILLVVMPNRSEQRRQVARPQRRAASMPMWQPTMAPYTPWEPTSLPPENAADSQSE